MPQNDSPTTSGLQLTRDWRAKDVVEVQREMTGAHCGSFFSVRGCRGELRVTEHDGEHAMAAVTIGLAVARGVVVIRQRVMHGRAMLHICVMLVLGIVCMTSCCEARIHAGLAEHRRRPGLRGTGHDKNENEQTHEAFHNTTLSQRLMRFFLNAAD